MYFSKEYLNDSAFTVTFGRVGRYPAQSVGFSRVSGLEAEREFEELQVGGINDRTQLLWKPSSKSGTLVLERGVGMTRDWLSALRPGIRLGTTIDILINNGEKDPNKSGGRVYHIEDGVIAKISIGALDALSGKLLIENMEIKYTGLTVGDKTGN